MNETNNTEKLTREKENRALEIALIVSRLPEKEQDKIYYLAKYAELFNAYGNANAPRAAAL